MKLSITAAAMAVMLMLSGCGAAPATTQEQATEAASVPVVSSPEPEKEKETEKARDDYKKNAVHAVMKFTNGDEIELDLYPDEAPLTVDNFVNLAKSGFYNGTIIHRVVKDFIIQGGGYDAEYNRKTGASEIKGEFISNGFKNSIKHERGVISMARIGTDPDSASSQFFIMQKAAPHLDGDYAAFGEVTKGMTVVDKIADSKIAKNTPAGLSELPEDLYVIEKITIEEK